LKLDIDNMNEDLKQCDEQIVEGEKSVANAQEVLNNLKAAQLSAAVKCFKFYWWF